MQISEGQLKLHFLLAFADQTMEQMRADFYPDLIRP